MEAFHPSSNATQTRGALPLSNLPINTGSSPLKGSQLCNPTSQTNTPTTVVATPLPTTTTATMTSQDAAAFAHPAQLNGETILSIATRYATTDIAANVNSAAGKEIMTQGIASYRLQRAVKAYAAKVGQTADQVRAELVEARKNPGVKCKGANSKTESGGDEQQQHTGDTTEDEDESQSDDAFAPPTFTSMPSTANDAFLFSNSKRLVGETLLALAAKYSNIKISQNVAKAGGIKQTTLSQGAVSFRITAALKARAKATSITVEQARANLHAAREGNNVKVRAADGTRRNPNRKPVVSKRKAVSAPQGADESAELASKKSKVEPAPQAVVATTTTSEGADAEMTDSSSGDSQEGYSADEVDAANALVLLFRTTPPSPPSQEVLDAASIIMDMHRDDGAETDDEVSDTEMDEAEFMADFQAQWRPETPM
jgi:hypothetical protein